MAHDLDGCRVEACSRFAIEDAEHSDVDTLGRLEGHTDVEAVEIRDDGQGQIWRAAVLLVILRYLGHQSEDIARSPTPGYGGRGFTG